jgi:hypothetical protein
MKDRVYVYAILDDGIGVRRILRRRIEIIQLAGFHVAVEHLEDAPVLSESTLRMQHEIVLRIAARAGAILPVRFGAFVDETELEALLLRRRRVLRAALTRVRGRVQMTVRILGHVNVRRPVRPARSGTAFLKARRAAARPVVPPMGRAVQAAVRSLVAGEQVDRGHGSVVVTLHHLVERNLAARYRRLVRAHMARIGPSAELTVSGPWPPFAFAPELLA